MKFRTRKPLIYSLGFVTVAIGAFGQSVVYHEDFEKAAPGNPPAEMMVLDGAFTVRQDGTNKFLELPGSPLDSYAVQFGPAAASGQTVTARIRGTGHGRRFPTFGVGLGGTAGWRLQVTPAKRMLELFSDEELKASAPFDWTSGEWTHLLLSVRAAREGLWKIEGKAWPENIAEPAQFSISAETTNAPTSGRASLLGSPFSGTPLQFDDLKVTAPDSKP